MRSHTVATLVAAGLAAVAALFMAQSIRGLDAPRPAEAAWASRMLGGVARAELASQEPDVGAVRRALEACQAALRGVEQSVRSADVGREVAGLEDAYRQWRVVLERHLELREKPEAEAQLRQERVATRERLLEQVERVTSQQDREAAGGREAVLASVQKVRLGAASAVLAAVVALFAAFLGARVRAEQTAGPVRASLGTLAAEQTTLTVPLNADQEVAVRLEVRPRR